MCTPLQMGSDVGPSPCQQAMATQGSFHLPVCVYDRSVLWLKDGVTSPAAGSLDVSKKTRPSSWRTLFPVHVASVFGCKARHASCRMLACCDGRRLSCGLNWLQSHAASRMPVGIVSLTMALKLMSQSLRCSLGCFHIVQTGS